MASVLDVAAYILKKQGPMDAMKLQKLCYYSQAWSLAWDEAPLFKDKIEAWTFGPVIPRLYRAHRRQLMVRRRDIDGDPKSLSRDQRETVDAVLESYGRKSGQWLSELTHREPPWREARRGIRKNESSNRPITRAVMRDYYSSLTSADATPIRDMSE